MRVICAHKAGLELFERFGQRAGAFSRAVVGELVERQIARDAREKGAQRPRFFGRNGIPCADPYVAQALLRVALVRQNAPDHAAAEPAIFLLALCDAVFAALIIEPDDLFIVQDDHLSFLSCMKDVWFVFTCTDEMRGKKVARFAAIFLL